MVASLEASVAGKGAAAAYWHACFLRVGDENRMVTIGLTAAFVEIAIGWCFEISYQEW